MNDLDKTLMLKRPGLIVRTQRPCELMTAPAHSRYSLMAEALRLQRKGVLEIEQDAPTWNDSARRYELRVRRLKEPAPAWTKIVIVTGSALFVLAVLFVLAWRAVQELSTGAGLVFLVVLLVAFIAWTYRRHRTQVSVTTTTVVRVRR